MKGLLAFMSNLMLFLTLATLATGVATFFAHKLRQRAKPDASASNQRVSRDAPSLVQAFDPSPSKPSGSKD